MFNEANTVENYIIHLLTGQSPITEGPAMVKESRYGPALPRQSGDVLIEDYVRQALIRLNPEIADQKDGDCLKISGKG